MNGFDHRGLRRELRKQVRSQHPRLREALLGDARVTAANRGERSEFRSRADAALQLLRLAWGSDAFLAQAAYRLKTRLQSLGVPILPQLLHRLAIWSAQVSIGANAVVVDDVPARTTVVGAPARPTEAAEAAAPDGDGDLA